MHKKVIQDTINQDLFFKMSFKNPYFLTFTNSVRSKYDVHILKYVAVFHEPHFNIPRTTYLVINVTHFFYTIMLLPRNLKVRVLNEKEAG